MRTHLRKAHPDQFVSKHTRRISEPIAAPPPPAPPPPPEPAKEIIQTITVEIPVRVPIEQTLRSLTTPTLLAEVLARLFHRLDKLEDALTHHGKNGNGQGNGLVAPSSTSPLRQPTLTPDPPITKRAPRIAIGGLHRDQFEHVRHKLEGKDCELTWIDTTSRKATTYPQVDAVVLTKFIGHHWSNAAQTQIGHDRVYFADGISSVVQKCYDFLSREHAAAHQ